LQLLILVILRQIKCTVSSEYRANYRVVTKITNCLQNSCDGQQMTEYCNPMWTPHVDEEVKSVQNSQKN